VIRCIWRAKWPFFKDVVEDGSLRLEVYACNERVCHSREGAKLNFFYVYAYFFQDLSMTVLFKDWQVDVLREIHYALTHIHPNTKASM